MRKIDQQLLSAIDERRSFAKGNRSTTVLDNGNVEVRFHGHHIATVTGRAYIAINNCGYWTNTTKQILNELLRDIVGYSLYQKNFDWFVSTAQGDVEYTGGWVEFA
tara:strand:- start:2524 stop:2841 length:318 start_codon:yes stop_codon:yes gene_type:complete